MPSIITKLVNGLLGVFEELHPKLKVPAVLITGATIALGALAVAGANIPAAVPYTSLATTILTVVIGWFVPAA